MKSSVSFICMAMLTAALGCGDSDDNNTPYSGEGTCEKAPEGDITWSYSGSDPICQFALYGLNNPDENQEDSECAMGVAALVLTEVDGKCIASASGECEGAEVDMQCIVDAAGKGDCSVSIKGTVEGQNVDCTFTGEV